MKQSGKCGKCGSTRVIAQAMVAYKDQGTDKCLQIRVDQKPSAMIFKHATRSELSAWVCADCGYTELYVANPQSLYKAFQEAQRNTLLKLRTAAKGGHEESVGYVAKNQHPGRISLLFTNTR